MGNQLFQWINGKAYTMDCYGNWVHVPNIFGRRSYLKKASPASSSDATISSEYENLETALENGVYLNGGKYYEDISGKTVPANIKFKDGSRILKGHYLSAPYAYGKG